MSQSASKQQISSSYINPEQSSSISKTKSQANYTQNYQQLKHQSHMMRVAANLHLKHAQNIWKLDTSQLQQYFSSGSYKQLPRSPISISQLFKLQKSKISRSETKCYFGQILNKKKEGLGIAIYREGKIYQGTFHDNQKSGYGVEVYANGNLFVGNYSQNKKHGKGSFFWFSLSDQKQITSEKQQNVIQQYHGDWWGGLPDGYGEHHKNNGDFYIGRFKNGLKHGDGVQMYGNGDKYKGEFINGLSEGYGQYSWNDGSIFKGDFKQGSRNGYGIWKGGQNGKQVYKGHYMIDKKHGYGVYDWGNGYVYKGFFMDDLRYGEGQLYLNDEIQYKGYWENGQKVDEKPLNYPSKQYNQTATTSIKDSGIRNNSHQKVSYSRVESRGKTAKTRRNNTADKKRNQSKQSFQVSINRQTSQQKSRVGHRNCVPCQAIGKMPKRNWKP